MPNSFETQNELCFSLIDGNLHSHFDKFGTPVWFAITLDRETHFLFLLFWRKVNLPLRSVEPFVATKAFHTGQQHLFFSPVSCIVSCFSWTPWRKTIDTVINNCAEIVFVSWFWASLQQASKNVEQTSKTFMQPKWNATKKVDKTANLVSHS